MPRTEAIAVGHTCAEGASTVLQFLHLSLSTQPEQFSGVAEPSKLLRPCLFKVIVPHHIKSFLDCQILRHDHTKLHANDRTDHFIPCTIAQGNNIQTSLSVTVIKCCCKIHTNGHNFTKVSNISCKVHCKFKLRNNYA